MKAGDYPLNLDLPVMVRVQERAKRGGGGRNPFKDFFGDNSPFGSSMFDDSVFDNFFGQTTEKELTLHTDGAVDENQGAPCAGASSRVLRRGWKIRRDQRGGEHDRLDR